MRYPDPIPVNVAPISAVVLKVHTYEGSVVAVHALVPVVGAASRYVHVAGSSIVPQAKPERLTKNTTPPPGPVSPAVQGPPSAQLGVHCAYRVKSEVLPWV